MLYVIEYPNIFCNLVQILSHLGHKVDVHNNMCYCSSIDIGSFIIIFICSQRR